MVWFIQVENEVLMVEAWRVSSVMMLSISLSGEVSSSVIPFRTLLDQSEACFHEQVGEDVMKLQRER